MPRWFLVVAPAMALVAVDASISLAAEAGSGWPAQGGPFSRGPGAYLSPWKILSVWVLFLCWVRTTDWISVDGQLMKLRYGRWNSIVFFSFLASLILFWILPSFILGFVLMVVAYAAPLSAYVVYRNKAVQPQDKVLSRTHIRRWIVRKASAVGIKLEGAEIDPRDLGPEVKIAPLGAPATATTTSTCSLPANRPVGFPRASCSTTRCGSGPRTRCSTIRPRRSAFATKSTASGSNARPWTAREATPSWRSTSRWPG